MLLEINNITLNVEIAGSGPPLLLLHGFTGSATTWTPYLESFGAHRQTLALDIIGHGLSDAPPDPQRYSVEQCVADILALFDRLDVERADVLGYSMGGRVALHLAGAAPERVRKLVLESASPGLAEASERKARTAADETLADSIERDGLAAFVERWQQIPLFASQSRLPADVRAMQQAQRMQNNPRGLANSLRGMGTGQQASLWERLDVLNVPTLLVTGALDTKYCQIAQKMVATMPAAQMVTVPNAGHSVHLEQPAQFEQIVLDFLLA